jgi:mRNA interferase RelE/StbE
MASIQKWTIELDPAAQRELDKLDKPVARRILKFLYQRIGRLENPQQIGERLTGTLSQFWKYRVGYYRVICSLGTCSASGARSPHRPPQRNLLALNLYRAYPRNSAAGANRSPLPCQ